MRKSLHSPVADFLLLGGGSLFALLMARLTSEALGLDVAWTLGTTLALANVINHPHFACSYQIFYSDFRAKLFSTDYESSLRFRYLLIGVAAPVVLVLIMAALVISKAVFALGLFANVMFFLVGWHYVKQGYGMAMVDATLKRAFFSDEEKKILLRNAYVVWLLAWLWINHLTQEKPGAYYGIPYQAVPVPMYLVLLVAVGAVVSFAKCAVAMLIRYRAGQPLAWNGLLAYGVSLYAWLLVRDPIVVLWIPLFHSLQYLAVVWRFQVNKSKSRANEKIGFKVRFFSFFSVSFVLGYGMFWGVPGWLNESFPYDKNLFGASLFFFLSWVFINVHHYLLDTVMWRKGNPDVKRYLFGS